MMRVLIAAVAVGLLVGTTGCAHNAIVANNALRVGVFYGDVGVKGDGNNVTILRGSRVPKLSILGNRNMVTVEENVTLAHVEFWGLDNTVSIPETLTIRITEMGRGHQIIRRQIPWREEPRELHYYPPAGVADEHPWYPAAESEPSGATVPQDASTLE
jgi:hypothetical protein